MKKILVVPVALAGVGLAACGGAHQSALKSTSTTAAATPTPRTMTRAAAAQAYQNYLLPVQTATRAMPNFTAAMTVDQVTTALQPLAKAERTYSAGLLSLSADYPQAASDLQAAAAAAGTQIADIDSLRELSDMQRISQDAMALRTADNAVRVDLGVPQGPLTN